MADEKKPRPAKPKGPSGGRKKRKGMCLEDRPCLEPNAGAIDVGAREMYVAVPPDRDEHPVRAFPTFTQDLQALAQWLKACGVTTVAMESTGVYWIPLYEILEAHGIRPCLTDAHHLKNVPGRRDYCARRFVRTRKYVRCERCGGIAGNWPKWRRNTSSTCTRR